jgi:hypothetical protein
MTLIFTIACFALTSCGKVINETRGTIIVYGVPYTTLTRQFEQSGETITTGAVIYNNRMYGCNTLLAGDCERRVELLSVDDTLGRITVGTVPSTYIIRDPNEPAVTPLQIRLWSLDGNT